MRFLILTLALLSCSCPAQSTRAFVLLNSAQVGASIADLSLTQQCIDAHTCVEGNPLLPRSTAGRWGVTLGVSALTVATSWLMRKHRKRGWYAGPVVGIAAHGMGIAVEAAK